jgi:hypothetical protein
MKKVRFVFKTISMIVLIVIMVYELATSIITGEPHTDVIWHVVLVIPAGLYNFIQIMGYGKYDILRLMRPSGTKTGVISMIRSLFSHWTVLILIPMFVSIMLFLAFEFVFGFVSAMSAIFVSVYIIQVLPLKVKQEKYTKRAYLAIIDARDEMKTSRILLSLPDTTEHETEMALRRHIAAEEMISVHSSYLHVSASLFSMFLGGIRLLLPIAGTAIGGIYQLLVVAGG